MKCEILFGPEAGKTKHYANNDPTAHSLIQSGLLRLIENEVGELVKGPNGGFFPKSAPAPEPRWSVQMVTGGADSQRFPAIVFEVGTTNYERFAGDPKEAAQGFGKREVPSDILKQYAKMHRDFYKKR